MEYFLQVKKDKQFRKQSTEEEYNGAKNNIKKVGIYLRKTLAKNMSHVLMFRCPSKCPRSLGHSQGKAAQPLDKVKKALDQDKAYLPS